MHGEQEADCPGRSINIPAGQEFSEHERSLGRMSSCPRGLELTNDHEQATNWTSDGASRHQLAKSPRGVICWRRKKKKEKDPIRLHWLTIIHLKKERERLTTRRGPAGGEGLTKVG